MANVAKKRPKHLNLFQITLPIQGFASILHRVSGAALFLMLPVLIWLLQLSLGNGSQYELFRAITGNILVKLILLGLLWSYLHHFCMGIRVLLIDLHVGVDKAPAKKSAIAVLVVSLALTLILGASLW